MADLDSIVTINITIQDAVVTRAGFGTPMILTHEAPFGPELVRIYTGTADMVTDGFSAVGSTVICATKIFSQNPKVTRIKVGIRESTQEAMTRILTVAINTEGTNYTVTINGTAFTVVGLATPTLTAGALVTEINGGTEPVTATDNVDGTLDLVEDAPLTGLLFGLTHTINLITQDDTTAESGIAADYAAVKVEDDDFFGVLMTSSATLEIVALSAVVNADRKIYLANSADEDILSDTASNLAETLEVAGSNRTALIFGRDNFEFAGAAWMGERLPSDPGSSTWAFKTLAGVSVDTLTPTQISNLESNDANHYTVTAGLNKTLQGTMVSGRFIDITRGIDFLQARMTERIFGQLANLEKIPFTNAGVALIESEIRAQLTAGIRQGLLAATPEPTVSVPDVTDSSQVSSNDKAARLLPNVTFTATLAGAIHKITINGTVSV